MPKVPVYDNFQVIPNTVPQVQVRAPDVPDTVGAQLREQGQAAQRAGNVLNRVALDAVTQANQVRVNDAMNQAVQAKLKLTYDQSEGFVNLKGDAALTRPDGKSLDEEYSEKYQKQLDQIAQSLGNDAQRRAFMADASRLATQFRGSLTQHVAREFTEYQVGVQQGTIATARDQMALDWADPEAVGQSIRAIKAATAEEGRLRGWSGKQVEAAIVDALSPGHATVIASAVDAGNLDYAKEYAKQVNEELTPQARLQIKKALDEGEFETRTQNAADEIVAKYGADTSAALKAVREKYQGKEEDAIVQRIKAIDSEREALRERAQRNAADQAWRFVAQGKTPPPSLMAALDGRDAVSIRRTLTDGPPQRTSMTKWLEFTNMTPQQLAQMDPTTLLRDYRTHFSDADMRNANEMILAAKGLRGKGPANGDGLQLMTTQDLVKSTARQIGVLPKSGDKLTPAQEEEFDRFRNAMQTKINAWEAANGKKASPEVLADMLNKEKLNKVYLDTFGRDPQQAVIALKPEQLDKAYVRVGAREIRLTAIPGDYRADAIRRIQAKGLPVTEQMIATMWAADNPKK